MEQVTVAVVARPHGLNGDLYLHLETDRPQEAFEAGRVLWVADPPIGMPDRLTVAWSQPHGRGWLLGVEELSERAPAERYAGCRLWVRRQDLSELGKDEFLYHDLVGLEVRRTSGQVVGRIMGIYEMGGRPLLAVGAGGKEHLVPFTRPLVQRVDPEAGVLWIELPEGLLEL